VLRVPTRAFIALIILTLSINSYGFFWENVKLALEYNKIFSQKKESHTKEDINVILIVIDALRADHLGCYGYRMHTSPHIDAFAKDGVLFKNCYAQASVTDLSVASILTSLSPSVHGVFLLEGVMPYGAVTVAEILQAQGYITFGFTGNACLKAIFNFNQGFDFYDDYLVRDRLYNIVLRQFRNSLPFFKKMFQKKFDYRDRSNIKSANKRIVPWLEKHRYDNFFMYIHYMDPHRPYSPPPPYSTMFLNESSEDICLYDGEIRFVDEYINQFFEKLKSLGIYDKTLIIITADHGEAFGEHRNYEHGTTIYQEEIQVPLIIKYTKSIPKDKIVTRPVRSIDITPTILNILNVNFDGYLDGVSLIPAIKETNGIKSYGRIIIDQKSGVWKTSLKGVIKNINNNEWKYIFTEQSKFRDVNRIGNEELYNLTEDPNELNNLIGREHEILKIMKNELSLYKEHCKEKALLPLKRKLDYETIQQLKSLGYIQ
jgi:arylsulfatase A-like enzyme